MFCERCEREITDRERFWLNHDEMERLETKLAGKLEKWDLIKVMKILRENSDYEQA